MSALQTINLGTAPAGSDGDAVRTAFLKDNANITVLNTQDTLSSVALIITAQALTAAHIGKRVNINLSTAGTINVPAASTCGLDQVILLRNTGSTIVTLAITVGSGDTLSVSKLNPGETVLLDTDGVHTWTCLMRGRTNSDNEIVNGNCAVLGSETVGGTLTVSGGLTVSGKVNGVNSPNLLLNGSAEFGAAGWNLGATLSAQRDATGGVGTYFANTTVISGATVYPTSLPFPVGDGTILTMSADVSTLGVSSGTVQITATCYNSGGAFISNIGTTVIPNGTSNARYSSTFTTPAGTASVAFEVALTAATVSAFGLVVSRVKVERGTNPSLYSQEASIVYLQGSPSLSGRPTFNGATPWDSGNLPSPIARVPVVLNQTAAGSGLGAPTSNIINFGSFTSPAAGGVGVGNVCAYATIGPSGNPTAACNWNMYLQIIRSSDGAVIATGPSSGITTMLPGNGAFNLSCSIAFIGLAASTSYNLRLVIVSTANPGVSTSGQDYSCSGIIF